MAEVELAAAHVEIGPRLALGRPGLDCQRAEVRSAEAAGELQAGVDQDGNGDIVSLQPDRAGKERKRRVGGAEVEDLGSLKKEEALLRKEEGCPAEIELLRIRLGLGEVGVDGEVRLGRGRDAVAEV